MNRMTILAAACAVAMSSSASAQCRGGLCLKAGQPVRNAARIAVVAPAKIAKGAVVGAARVAKGAARVAVKAPAIVVRGVARGVCAAAGRPVCRPACRQPACHVQRRYLTPRCRCH